MSARRFRAGVVIAAVLGAASVSALGIYFGRPLWTPLYQRWNGNHTVADAVEMYGGSARTAWKKRLAPNRIEYPPAAITFVALKREQKLEVWADTGAHSVKIHEYPILAASGELGPKLKAGDRQVPEGLYGIEGLNPNSHYHLSMKVGYPNAFDRKHAAAERRTDLGGDIFIHGKNVSIGCLAMGDPAIEELFVLAADVGHEKLRVLIAPCDFRAGCNPDASQPPWLGELYAQIRADLAKFATATQ